MVTYDSPIGRLLLKGSKALESVSLERCPVYIETNPVLEQALAWLEAYFGGAPLPLMPPLSSQGTTYQQALWRELEAIPYGQALTYGQLSERLQARGCASSPRSVGRGLGSNPILLFRPCHRVIAHKGLGGFAEGVEVKKWLLTHEGIRW